MCSLKTILKLKLKLMLVNLKNIDNYPYIFCPVGVLLTIIEIRNVWFPKHFEFLLYIKTFCISLVIGFFIFICKIFHKINFEYKINDKDVYIKIKVGNIFDEKNSDIVIPFNNFFDTEFENEIISKESIQGQFQMKYWKNLNDLDKIINKKLKNEKYTEESKKIKGKKKKYNIGTTIKVNVPSNSNFFYLVAISEMNNDCVTHISSDKYREALYSLWDYIYNHGNKGNISVPILGSKYSRLDMNRNEILKEIIKSFIASINEYNFSNKLTIVIYEKDLQYINMEEINEFLMFYCKYRNTIKNKAYNLNSNIGKAEG